MRVGQSQRRRDDNEREIVDALRRVGILVWRLSDKGLPDLLAFQAPDHWLPIEVKQRGSTASLTPAQAETYAATTFPIVDTVAHALALFGIEMSGSTRS